VLVSVVQKIFPLSNGDYVKLTVAQWLTPSGKSIDKNGITPDVITKDKEDALAIAMEQNR
jgi:carboxyl-terminal processing protease